jgi:streptogramin lyase
VVYGIALDKYGKIWVTELGSTAFSTFDSTDPVGTVKVFNQTGQYSYAQGVATDDNGDIFIAGCGSAIVGHYKQIFINGL